MLKLFTPSWYYSNKKDLALKNLSVFKFSSVIFLIILSLMLTVKGWAAFDETAYDEEIFLVRGDLKTVITKELSRISITNPEVVELVNVEYDSVLLLATDPGLTTLFLWDKFGKRTILVRVAGTDLSLVKSRLEKRLKKAEIEGVNLEIDKREGKVVATGSLSEDIKEKYDSLAGEFEGDMLNFVKEKDLDLVQVDVQIYELSETLSKVLGFDWTSALAYNETAPGTIIDKPLDFFKVGDFSRTTAIQSTLNFLISEGKGRVLSKPKLVVVSGSSASFLVGGQVPIVSTTTSSGGNVQESVNFRDFGVGLNITPTIKDNNKIDIILNIEVSDVDESTKVGDNVGFTTRSTQTKLFLDDGQTVIIAGLIKKNESDTVTRVPFFSDVPILGMLFRKRQTSIPTDQELVISITPTIIRQRNKENAEFASSVSTEQFASQAKGSGTLSSDYLPVASHQTNWSTPKGSMTSKSYISEDMIFYIRTVQEKIARTIVYPVKAREHGWEGKVKLALHILNDGTLIYASIKESSGYDVFDENAIRMAKDLAPYTGFPPGSNLHELTITIPIIYSLSKN